MDYRQAGVDIDAGNEAVRRIRALARSTSTAGVLSDIGSFGGLFRLDTVRYREPVLVSSADGVGTKLRLAFATGQHRTVGADLVNHCVNDILVQGAEPLFFLDYLATGHLSPAVAEDVVSGIATACRDNGCALLGGETAEMPGFYADGEYDLAGFVVGAVERSRIIDGRRIEPGDRLIGLNSSGLHTNGYSLARRIVFDVLGLSVDTYVPDLGDTVGAVLLRTHRSYLSSVWPLLAGGGVRGIAHITGGGLTENLPRILPPCTSVVLSRAAWEIPAVFRFLQERGQVPTVDMFRTFNMGIGLVLVVDGAHSDAVLQQLSRTGETGARMIGRVETGTDPVVYDPPL